MCEHLLFVLILRLVPEAEAHEKPDHFERYGMPYFAANIVELAYVIASVIVRIA